MDQRTTNPQFELTSPEVAVSSKKARRPLPVGPGGNERELTSLIKANSHRHHTWQVWSDFVEMFALSLSNSCDHAQRDVREARYMQIVKAYSREEVERFPRMVACVVEELEAGPQDFLGHMFMALELGNHWKGQYFTPYPVCSLMARMTAGDAGEHVKRHGYVHAMEPCVGAGAMVIALSEALRDAGLNPQTQLHVQAIDIDATAVHMAYVQLSLLHIPAVVSNANSLAPGVKPWSVWFTPAHVLGRWEERLALRETFERMQEALAAIQEAPQASPDRQDIEDAAASELDRRAAPTGNAPQLTLF